MQDNSLDSFLNECSRNGWPPSQIFARGTSQGFGLSQILERIDEFDEYSSVYRDPSGFLRITVNAWPESWVDQLIAATGSVENAQRVIDATDGWRDFDIESHLREVELEQDLRTAATPSEALALLLLHPKPEAYHWWPLRRFSLEELAITDGVPVECMAAVIAAIGPRVACIRLLEAHGADRAIDTFRQLPDHAQHFDGLTETSDEFPHKGRQALLELLIQEWNRDSQSLWDLLDTAKTLVPKAVWLGAFYRAGFGANATTLAALEHSNDVPSAVNLLKSVGVPDTELVSGLVMNGAGSRLVLKHLQDADWLPSRMVQTLRQQDWLDAEIREALKQLGVSTECTRKLLNTALLPHQAPQ